MASEEMQIVAKTEQVKVKNLMGASYKWIMKCTFCKKEPGTEGELKKHVKR